MQIIFPIFMFIFGACLGSFLCCQARRLHFKTASISEVPTPKKGSTKRTSSRQKSLGARSVCLSCGYQLKWYDNIPIFSWLFLKGKCRKCHHQIGLAELFSELGLGLAFMLVAIGMVARGITFTFLAANPIELATIIFSLFFVAIIGFLAIYDGLYGQLPTSILTISIICAIIIVILRERVSLSVGQDLLNLLFATLILGGLYLLLYLISKGKWVGDGDWLLGLALALVLGTPWLALIALFLSNLFATLIMLPSIKRGHSHKIYFGPFMVAAFVVVFAFSHFFYAIISL